MLRRGLHAPARLSRAPFAPEHRLATFATGAFPAFFLAMLLIVLFGVKLKRLPLGGAPSVGLLLAPWPQRIADISRHMVLPVLALLLTSLADVYYLTRNSLG